MQVGFGTFVLDTDTRELRCGSACVPLSPKAFELLRLLVAHRPKAMAKHDLIERLWPGTFVVEKNLPNLVAEIRAALGEDSSNARFIRTVHRFGYAFRDTSAPSECPPAPLRRGHTSFILTWAAGRIVLHEGAHVLGRDLEVDIFLDHPGISRRHARITVSADQAIIEDIGSKNGTFVGTQRVGGARVLADGDVVALGSLKLTCAVVQAPKSTETQQTLGAHE